MSEQKYQTDWIKWSDQRPPNKPGVYRWRTTTTIFGKELTPEWTEKLSRCGMGYGEDEYWPVSSSDWTGSYRRMTSDIEWRELTESDPDHIVWGGMNLLPCPFTGKTPIVHYHGRYVTAPPYMPEYLILQHWLGNKMFNDVPAMETAWNTRADNDQSALISELVGALEAIYEVDNTGPAAHEVNDKGKAVNWHNTKGKSAELAYATLAKAREIKHG